MATSWDSIPFGIMLDGDGAYPLPSYETYGSTRHIANSNKDITQYTGSGAGTFAFDLYLARADYDELVDALQDFPRVAADLTIDDDSYGNWYLDSLSAPRVLLGGKIFVSVTFKEAPA